MAIFPTDLTVIQRLQALQMPASIKLVDCSKLFDYLFALNVILTDHVSEFRQQLQTQCVPKKGLNQQFDEQIIKNFIKDLRPYSIPTDFGLTDSYKLASLARTFRMQIQIYLRNSTVNKPTKTLPPQSVSCAHYGLSNHEVRKCPVLRKNSKCAGKHAGNNRDIQFQSSTVTSSSPYPKISNASCCGEST